MKPNKKYLLQIVLGLTGYGLAVFAVSHFYKAQYPHGTWLLLLPVLPLIYIAAAIVRHISEKDEMWRKIMTEAWTFSAIATGFTCMGYGFFRGLGAPEFHAEWVMGIMAVYAVIGLFFSRRRYIGCDCK